MELLVVVLLLPVLADFSLFLASADFASFASFCFFPPAAALAGFLPFLDSSSFSLSSSSLAAYPLERQLDIFDVRCS